MDLKNKGEFLQDYDVILKSLQISLVLLGC